jgi:hypothetical protein
MAESPVGYRWRVSAVNESPPVRPGWRLLLTAFSPRPSPRRFVCRSSQLFRDSLFAGGADKVLNGPKQIHVYCFVPVVVLADCLVACGATHDQSGCLGGYESHSHSHLAISLQSLLIQRTRLLPRPCLSVRGARRCFRFPSASENQKLGLTPDTAIF